MNCRWRKPPDQGEGGTRSCVALRASRQLNLFRWFTPPAGNVSPFGLKRSEKTFEVNDGVKPIQARRASEWFLQAEEPLARASGLYFHAAHAGLLTNVSNSSQTSFTRSLSCPNNSRHASMSTGVFPAIDSRRPAVSLAVKAPR